GSGTTFLCYSRSSFALLLLSCAPRRWVGGGSGMGFCGRPPRRCLASRLCSLTSPATQIPSAHFRPTTCRWPRRSSTWRASSSHFISGSCLTAGHSRRCRRSEEHTSELQSQSNLVCRLLLEKKKK